MKITKFVLTFLVLLMLASMASAVTAPYWVENTSTNVWIKVPVISSSNTTYYQMTKGSGAPSIEQTMLFGDDFYGNTINTSKWTVPSGAVTVANSKATMAAASSSRLESIGTFGPNVTMEWAGRWYATGGSSSSVVFGMDNYPTENNRIVGYKDKNGLNMCYSAKAGTSGSVTSNWVETSYNVNKIYWHARGTPQYYTYVNGVARSGSPYTSATKVPVIPINVFFQDMGTTAYMNIDTVWVHKNAATEPTATVTDMGAYYLVKVNSTSATVLTNYQVPLSSTTLEVSTKNDSMTFTQVSQTEYNNLLSGNSYPSTPTSLSSTQGSDWIRHTWSAATGAVKTDSFNISINGAWYNSSNAFYNQTSMSAHAYSNLTVYAWNSTSNVKSLASASQSVRLANKAITISGIDTTYSTNEAQQLSVDASATDGDSDTPVFSCNRTDLFTDFSTSTGAGSWTPSYTQAGTYKVKFSATDGYGSTSDAVTTITVSNVALTPAAPTFNTATSGNFWVRHSWNENFDNAHTDQFRIQYGSSWQNSTATFLNRTLSAHAWSNVTLYAYNTTTSAISSPVTQSLRVANNPITVTNLVDKNVIQGGTFTFNADATDLDSDSPTFSCNRTDIITNFSTSTGAGSWTAPSDATGPIYIGITASDAYGSSNTDSFAITIVERPQTPQNLAYTRGNMYVLWTWEEGTNTDSYRVKIDGTWTNGTTNAYVNQSYPNIIAHELSNITVYGYNTSSGVTSLLPATGSIATLNNPPVITNSVTTVESTIGTSQNVNIDSTDIDDNYNPSGDRVTNGDFSSGTTGWTNVGLDNFDTTSMAGSLKVRDASTAYCYQNVDLTDVNTLQILIRQAYANDGGMYVRVYIDSTMIYEYHGPDIYNYQINQDVSSYSGVHAVKIYSVAGGYGFYDNIHAYNVPNLDTPTFGCNRTDLFTNFNTSTGVGSWTPSSGNIGTTYVEFTSTDAYSGVDSYIVEYTINDGTIIAPQPTVTSANTGNFFVKHNWNAGSGNVTNYYIVNDGTEHNQTANYFNATGLSPHAWSNITITAYNTTGGHRAAVTDNVHLPNNAVILTDIDPTYSINEGQLLSLDLGSTDTDSDTPTFSCNRTDLFSFNTGTGVGTFTPSYAQAGTYKILFGVSDGYGSTDTEVVTLTVNNVLLTPNKPVVNDASKGNFYVYHSWTSNSTGFKTDSFRVNLGGSWQNSTATSYNRTLSAHGTSQITVYGWNSTTSSISSGVTQSVTLDNNPISISNLDDIDSNEGLQITVDANRVDLDSDTATFSCNRTDLFTDFSTSTGVGHWTPDYQSAGTYSVLFGVSDGYGSSDSQIITITVDNKVFTPATPINLNHDSGNFYVNWSWDAGTGNKTNSYNVNLNGVWTNGTTDSISDSSMNPHETSTIEVYAFNSSTNSLSVSSISDEFTLANNPVTITGLSNINIFEDETANVNANANDADNDEITFACNRTDLFTNFNTATGVGSWTPDNNDAGTYDILFTASDAYSSSDSEVITITVSNLAYIPATPVLDSPTIDQLSITHNWHSGTGNVTDSFIVNDGTNHDVGLTSEWVDVVSAHGWSNITIKSYNSTGLYSPTIQSSVQAPNRDISLNSIGNIEVTEATQISLDLGANDPDSDTPTFSCNRTDLFNDFSTSTGVGHWTPSTNDAGVYSILFSVSDGYGSSDSEIVTLTINEANYIPPIPTNLQHTGANFYVDWSWDAGSGNITNSYNVNVSGVWTNGTTNEYISQLGMAPHSTCTIHVYAVNSTSGALSEAITDSHTLVNNAPTITDYNLSNNPYSNVINLNFTASDLDSDEITYSTPSNLFTTDDPTSGVWEAIDLPEDTYSITFYANDSYGGSDSQVVNFAVSRPVPSIDSFTNSKSNNEDTSLSVYADESIEFSVTASNYNSTYWYVNDEQVASNVLTYNFENIQSTSTVEFVAQNPNGNATTFWTITVVNDIVPQITTTLNNITSDDSSSFSVVQGTPIQFTVDSLYTTGYRWEINYGDISLDSNTMNWDTSTYSGDYHVTVYADNVNGTDLFDWLVTINLPPENIYPTFQDWSNDFTNNQSTQFSVPSGTQINFTATILNSTGLEWFLNSNSQSTDAYFIFDTTGISGNNTVTATATNSNGSISKNWFINVIGENNAPIFLSLTNKSVNEGSALTFAVSAYDNDDDELTYGVEDLPSGATFEDNQFTWTPTNVQDGEYDVTFTVSDGIDTTSETITIVVNNVSSGGSGGGSSSEGTSTGYTGSSDPSSNLIFREKFTIKNALADTPKTSSFLSPDKHDIIGITYTPTKYGKTVGATIEKLKSNSVYTEGTPNCDIVYSHVNILVGSENYDQYTTDASVKFHVPQKWIEDNGISEVLLYSYENEKWVAHETKLMSITSEYNVYQADIDSYGYFAICANEDSIMKDSLTSDDDLAQISLTIDETTSFFIEQITGFFDALLEDVNNIL
jgi:PGF-pre-PGF domain-containing protein